MKRHRLNEASALGELNARISDFLQVAENAPPALPIEEEDLGSDEAEQQHSDNSPARNQPRTAATSGPQADSSSAAMIEMNLLLGVFEAQGEKNGGDILLPTDSVKSKLDDEDEVEAKAFLNIVRSMMARQDGNDDGSESTSSTEEESEVQETRPRNVESS